jgi:OOP family OmpA-OmpF porin
MKLKLLAGAAVAGLFAAAGASADPAPSGWYGAIDLGAHGTEPMVTTSQFTELGDSPANLRFRDDLDFAGFARVGYKISPHFRVELEGGYRPDSFNSINERYFAGRPPGSIGRVCNAAKLDICQAPNGAEDAWTFMGNVLYDFMPSGTIHPFLGGGIGAEHIHLITSGRITGEAGNQTFAVNQSDTQFAYQGIGGLSMQLNDNMSVDVTYRFLESARHSWATS